MFLFLSENECKSEDAVVHIYIYVVENVPYIPYIPYIPSFLCIPRR